MFYEKPRFVNHLDDVALQTVRDIYGGLLKPETKVLDLMASHVSHIPSHIAPLDLTVLGMNEEELKQNPRMSRYKVRDLNQYPGLPFDRETFDAVICTVSVEYLIDPMTLFRSVSDVLKPGGIFIVTFSNRWFEPKAVLLWKELHEFERLGFVLECFRKTNSFSGLHAFSKRGLPRPFTDKYFPGLIYSDPVYAVWGTKTDR